MPETYLYYIHDPMCSWCYAFNTSREALQTNLPTTIRMVYLLGGLAPDTDEPMPMDLRDSIQQNWLRIEQTVSSIRFNFDFWSLNTPYRSTYPACRAILAARKQGAEFEHEILKAIQTAYYEKARNPSVQSTLQECAAEAGLDKDKFIQDLASPAIEIEFQRELKLARSMNVFSYPTLRLLHNKNQYPINVDYLNHRTMLGAISDIMR